MGMLKVVESIVPAQHLLPGIGEKILCRSLLDRVHDNAQQRLVRMGGIGCLIRLRHLGSALSSHIGRNAGRIDTLASLATDSHDAGDMAACPGCDYLIHERGSLAETNDLQIPRPTVHVKNLDENVEIRVGILVAGRIDDESRPVGRIQQRLEPQIIQEPRRSILIQFRVRIDKKRRREIVGAPLRTSFTAIGDRRSRPRSQDDVLYIFPSARLSVRAQADRKGKGHPKNPFHIV